MSHLLASAEKTKTFHSTSHLAMSPQRLDFSTFNLESFSTLNVQWGPAILPQTVALLVILGFVGKWASDYRAQVIME